MRLHAATCLGIDSPTCLHEESLHATTWVSVDVPTCLRASHRQVGNLRRRMCVRATACIGIDVPTCPCDSSRNKKFRDINADACGCMEPQASAYTSLRFRATPCAEKLEKSMPMRAAAWRHKHRHRFPYFFGTTPRAENYRHLCRRLWLYT